MANSTFLLPCTHELGPMWGELGLTGLPAEDSTPVTAEQVRQVLHAQGWSLSECADGHEGRPISRFSAERRADGAWPPFSEIEVWPEFVAVRQGGYACWVVAVHASATSGPLVAWDAGGAGPVLCTPLTTYEQFADAFGYAGDAARDAAWSVPGGR